MYSCGDSITEAVHASQSDSPMEAGFGEVERCQDDLTPKDSCLDMISALSAETEPGGGDVLVSGIKRSRTCRSGLPVYT